MPPITINAKFDVGDTVYYALCGKGYNNLDQTCPVCNGTGEYVSPSSGRVKKCPGVHGYACLDGIIHAVYNNHYMPQEDVIMSIFIDENHKLMYETQNSFPYSYEDELYATIEEAQVVCDWRNKKNGSQTISESE